MNNTTIIPKTFNFDGAKLTVFPEGLKKYVHIEKLLMQHNKISEVPEWIVELEKLNCISMLGNLITSTSIHHFGTLKLLNHLTLDDNSLLTHLPKELGQCSYMSYFSASYCSIETIDPELFLGWPFLKYLHLCGNMLKSIPETIGSCNQLQVISFKQNKIRTLPLSIGQLSILHSLYVDNNHLSSLPSTFHQLFSLVWFSAANNYLITLPEDLNGLHSMETMVLSNNHLLQLPLSLCTGLPNLKWLFLDRNKLNYLPLDLGFLTNLVGLFVEYNYLHELPNSIGLLLNLQSCVISNNTSLKRIPISLFDLPSLQWLYLPLSFRDQKINKISEKISIFYY